MSKDKTVKIKDGKVSTSTYKYALGQIVLFLNDSMKENPVVVGVISEILINNEGVTYTVFNAAENTYDEVDESELYTDINTAVQIVLENRKASLLLSIAKQRATLQNKKLK